jgi:hypothetical protein
MKIRDLRAISKSDTLPHGGVLRFKASAASTPEEEAAIALQIRTAIEDGLKALEEQTSPFTSDVEPVPGAELQYLDLFDVATGDHIVVWRIECREIVRR